MTAIATPCPAKGAWLLAGDRVLLECADDWRLLDRASGKVLGRWPQSHTWVGAYSADGSTLALAEAGTVHVVRARDGRAVSSIATGARYTLAVALSPDGTSIVAAGLGKPPAVWDVASGRRVATLATEFGSASAAAWSGDHLAVATDDTAVRIYDRSGRPVATAEDSSFVTLALEWSADGKRLAIGRAGGVIDLVDPAGKRLARFPRHGDQVVRLLFAGETLFAIHRGQTKDAREALAWSLDGKASPMADRPAIGGGVVDGALWLVSPTEGGIEIWKR